jgi:hypothetical protein
MCTVGKDAKAKTTQSRATPRGQGAKAYSINEHDQKIFVETFINNYRVVSLIDSGSDLSILHYSLYKKIKPAGSGKGLEKSDIAFITTFSGQDIVIKGTVTWLVKPHRGHPGLLTTFHVIQDIEGIPDILLGNDLLKQYLGTVGYAGEVESPTPEVVFRHPVFTTCKVYQVSPSDMKSCVAFCTLKPNEIQDIEFTLNPASPVTRQDFILVTALNISELYIVPSRSELNFDPALGAYTATVCVMNISTELVSDFLVGKWEIVNKSTAVQIDSEDLPKMLQMVNRHPLGREILPSKNNSKINTPIMSINLLNTESSQKYSQQSDFETGDCVMAKEPTYEGEAVISPEIIEGGLDLPTIVYDTAEEAVGLHNYPPEIRPYIKRIFIDKYPESVSLHSLDAGDLSKTLGYTSLRLREGETLPRAKRIFHVSPAEQRHMDDILELLLKFRYIMRAPVTPSGHHLYGMSSYLIPRAKPNTLGRLIVDYSPINPLIESPASVIPEIGATLQFLQGKALFSSLDLRQAYLALRIDESSKPLTTFLTPSGAFVWNSLPTGAANSPIHFSNAITNVLQYEPDRDEKGELIYEKPNVVKQTKKVLKHTVSYFDDIVITSLWAKTFAEMLDIHFSNLEATVQRLAFHGCKISVRKCEFAKSKILFLGWVICRDYIIADPRRVNKVREFKFPDCKKACRAFLGLVNSLRRVISMDVVQQMSILTPLTSTKGDFRPEDKHFKAFEEIKRMLVSAPLYNNLIDEGAEKFMWVDASTSSGVIGCVLAQKKKSSKDEKIVPNYLDLDNAVHRIIYDKALPYEPAPLFTELPIVMPPPSKRKTIPPNIEPEPPLLGFTPMTVKDSFFYSLLSLMALFNCAVKYTVLELRKMAIKQVKVSPLNNKIKDILFNRDLYRYHKWVDDFVSGKIGNVYNRKIGNVYNRSSSCKIA